MSRSKASALFAVSILWAILPTTGSAQISFGVTQQNGVVSGGSLVVGGFVNPSRTGVRLGVNAGFSQLIGINTFTVRNGGGVNRTGQIAANGQNRRPTAAQFVKAASKFDTDRDGRLDKKELAEVGKAVLTELNKHGVAHSPGKANGPLASQTPPPTVEEMVDVFVTRSLTFDKNKDEALDATEAKRMAAALIRSLSA